MMTRATHYTNRPAVRSSSRLLPLLGLLLLMAAPAWAQDYPVVPDPLTGITQKWLGFQAAASVGPVTLVVFSGLRANPADNSDVTLYMQRIEGTTRIGQPQPLLDTSAVPLSYLSVLPFSDRLLVLWNDGRTDMPGAYFMWVDTSGARLGSEEFFGNYFQKVKVIRTSESIMVIWEYLDSTTVRAFNLAGDELGPPVQLGHAAIDDILVLDGQHQRILMQRSGAFVEIQPDGTLDHVSIPGIDTSDMYYIGRDETLGVLRDSTVFIYGNFQDSLPQYRVILPELTRNDTLLQAVIGRDSLNRFFVLYTIPEDIAGASYIVVQVHTITIDSNGTPMPTEKVGKIGIYGGQNPTWSIVPRKGPIQRVKGCGNGSGITQFFRYTWYNLQNGPARYQTGASGFYLVDGQTIVPTYLESLSQTTSDIPYPAAFPDSLLHGCDDWSGLDSGSLVTRPLERMPYSSSGYAVRVNIDGTMVDVPVPHHRYAVPVAHHTPNIILRNDSLYVTVQEESPARLFVYKTYLWSPKNRSINLHSTVSNPFTGIDSYFDITYSQYGQTRINGASAYSLHAHYVNREYSPDIVDNTYFHVLLPDIYKFNYTFSSDNGRRWKSSVAYNPNHDQLLVASERGGYTTIKTDGSIESQYQIPLASVQAVQTVPISKDEWIVLRDTSFYHYRNGDLHNTFRIAQTSTDAGGIVRLLRLYGTTFLYVYRDRPDDPIYHFQLYDIDSGKLQQLASIRYSDADNPFFCLNPADSSIAVLWQSSSGVRLTHLDKYLRVLRTNDIISQTHDSVAAPAGVFVGDSLYVVWTDYRNTTSDIYGTALYLPAASPEHREPRSDDAPPPVVIDDSTDADSTGTPPTHPYIASAAPNPAQNFLTLTLVSPFETQATIEILNSTGRRVQYIDNVSLGNGIQQLPIDIQSLSNGMYMILLHANGQVDSRRVVVFGP